jgi:hypothetical protein
MSTDAWTEEYWISDTLLLRLTKSETFYGADPHCANMFPPQCGAGGICGKKTAIVLAVLATA